MNFYLVRFLINFSVKQQSLHNSILLYHILFHNASKTKIGINFIVLLLRSWLLAHFYINIGINKYMIPSSQIHETFD